MDKKLRKKIEAQLATSMEGILSRIHPAAAAAAKKKIKEAGKLVAKKFGKSVATFEKKKTKSPVKTVKKKSTALHAKLKRASNGRFQTKKN